MINFCTLFDSAYLSRGLALYDSLCYHCKKFHIYIFAFDDICYQVLNALELTNATIILLEELEDSELLSVKQTRSSVEYFWTCTPKVILYVLNKYSVEWCTYLDADLYFYSSPEVLFDELGVDSVMITEHRYSRRYRRNLKYGKYCVQFMIFKNDVLGKRVLDWWKEACLGWCYDKYEDGKFGDQKYLDDWPKKFSGVHVMQNLGGGLAPWNIQQYDVLQKESKLFGAEKETGRQFQFIFFHFHGIKYYTDGKIDLGGYRLSKRVIDIIYKPYIRKLHEMKRTIPDRYKFVNIHGASELKLLHWKVFLRHVKRRCLLNILKNNTND